MVPSSADGRTDVHSPSSERPSSRPNAPIRKKRNKRNRGERRARPAVLRRTAPTPRLLAFFLIRTCDVMPSSRKPCTTNLCHMQCRESPFLISIDNPNRSQRPVTIRWALGGHSSSVPRRVPRTSETLRWIGGMCDMRRARVPVLSPPSIHVSEAHGNRIPVRNTHAYMYKRTYTNTQVVVMREASERRSWGQNMPVISLSFSLSLSLCVCVCVCLFCRAIAQQRHKVLSSYRAGCPLPSVRVPGSAPKPSDGSDGPLTVAPSPRLPSSAIDEFVAAVAVAAAAAVGHRCRGRGPPRRDERKIVGVAP